MFLFVCLFVCFLMLGVAVLSFNKLCLKLKITLEFFCCLFTACCTALTELSLDDASAHHIVQVKLLVPIVQVPCLPNSVIFIYAVYQKSLFFLYVLTFQENGIFIIAKLVLPKSAGAKATSLQVHVFIHIHY